MDRPKPSAEEFQRGRWDPVRWAWVYLGIQLHPGQIEMVNAYIRRNESRWRALYLWLLVAAGNRAGKTLGLTVIILHSCTYKITLEPPDYSNAVAVRRWGRLPYHWWHFAVEQGPAEQVLREAVAILNGYHPAQTDGCPWADQLGGADKIATMSDPGTADSPENAKWGPKERGEYGWIVFNAELGGAQVHFRSTKASALGALGQNMHGVSFDEAGLEVRLNWLVNEVLNARRLGTGGPFILISTPSADTSSDFEELWYTGDPEDPFRIANRFSMRMSSRDNIGFGLDQITFDAIVEGEDENWIAQNIDGYFIQAKGVWFNMGTVDLAFDPDLPEEEAPRENCVYVHALDPGLKDKCWSMVFRVKPDGTAVGVYLGRILSRQTTRGIVRLGKLSHHAYEQDGKSHVDTGVDTTALGGHMFRELIEEDDPKGIVDDDGNPMVPLRGIPVKSIEFGGVTKTKRQLLSDLKAAIDEGKIKMPADGFWREVRTQLRKYKLADRKVEQDLVMSLAIIVRLIRQAPVAKRVSTPLDMTRGWVPDEPVERMDDGINAKTMRAKMAERRRRQRALTAAGAPE